MATILNRLSTLLRANVNDLLDRASDPEKMLNQLIRDMDEAIAQAKEAAAKALAEQKLLATDLQEARRLAEDWRNKAQLAADKGSLDLARECLRRKRDYEKNAEIIEQQVSSMSPLVANLRREMNLLESKRDATERNRNMLLARQRMASAQEKLQRETTTARSYDPSSALSAMDERIRRQEAEVSARSELSGESLEVQLGALEASDADMQIEAELLELLGEGERLHRQDGATDRG
jgi:phage shock protein A